MRKLLYFLIVLVALYLGITYFFSGLILHTPDRDLATVYQMNQERWGLDLDSLKQTLPAVADFTIESTVDGATLKGWLFRPDTIKCGVVFAHGYSVNRANMLKYAPIFQDCGCALALYDHRGHGQSDEAYGSGGFHEATDLISVSEWLAKEVGLTHDRIGWYGESWGGSTVILAAERAATKPAWVVSESSFADWESAVMERGLKDYGNGLKLLAPGAFTWTGFRAGVDFDAVSPVKAVSNLAVPLLIFHSRADTLTYPVQGDQLAAAANPDLTTYHPLDWGAWHAHNIIWNREAYTQKVLDFVGDWCEE
ncbi:MAG: alpha/beta fold hydrolase [Bacteroidota bacterium]